MNKNKLNAKIDFNDTTNTTKTNKIEYTVDAKNCYIKIRRLDCC